MSIDIEALSTEEKIQLAEKLWNDLEKERAAPLSPAQQQLLQKRLEAHDKNPNAGKTWEEVKAKYFKGDVLDQSPTRIKIEERTERTSVRRNRS